MKSIFEYLDYRQFLADYYADRKIAEPSFSYKVWADAAGFKAKDFLWRVLRGGSRLSAQSAKETAKAMGLSPDESAHFKDLVDFNQAKTFSERERLYLKLRKQYVRRKAASPTRLIPHEQFEFYSEWRHSAIRSLINSYGFSGDYQWLSQAVYPAISVAKARKSVALMEKLGLIAKDGSGSYHLTDANISTGDEVRGGALLRFYRSGMDLMRNALEKLHVDKRNIQGLTMGISEDTYKKVVDRIIGFRQEIADLAGQDSGPDRVYQLNFHLFPLSCVKKKRGKKS
jgi:uncharacterized protein (TIGR02147 family)